MADFWDLGVSANCFLVVFGVFGVWRWWFGVLLGVEVVLGSTFLVVCGI